LTMAGHWAVALGHVFRHGPGPWRWAMALGPWPLAIVLQLLPRLPYWAAQDTITITFTYLSEVPACVCPSLGLFLSLVLRAAGACPPLGGCGVCLL